MAESVGVYREIKDTRELIGFLGKEPLVVGAIVFSVADHGAILIGNDFLPEEEHAAVIGVHEIRRPKGLKGVLFDVELHPLRQVIVPDERTIKFTVQGIIYEIDHGESRGITYL